ncbi:MAG TPA: diaminopimelate epimerase [Gaiellaceae bacterium]|nr:diaminopimelate epimerase [Gaiellaceae bacterium]
MTSSRWQAHGNVYLVAESGDAAMEPGLDGIMRVLSFDGDDVVVEVVNPDGSLAEMSGNGTRIVAAWLMERTGSDVARVHVGPRTVDVRRVGERLYESDMGEVEVHERERIDGVDVTAVTVGNPHAVVVGDPDDLPLLGPMLETHPRFPNRTNVQVARVDGPGEVTARVWERGVGETTASGSSAVAVAAATHGEGEVLVHFPGGDLRVRLHDGRATLVGPAEPVSGSAEGGA